MLRRFFLIICITASATAIGQTKYYSEDQNRLESCSFDENDSSRYSCYSKVLYDIFLNELNTNYEELDLNPGDILQSQIQLRLSSEGKFLLKSIDTDNEKIKAVLENKLAKLDRMIPVKNKDGEEEFGDFSMMFSSHVNDGGTLVAGLPKQTVGGFDDLVETVAFEVIENVPVYPGCKGESNLELKDCMSKQIQQHVIKKFNLNLANSLGLPEGIQRIYVQFKVDRHGKVVNVIARASHPALVDEAKRVVELLPQMDPGIQRGKAVGVMYSLPIVFKVEETKKAKRERLKREKEGRKKN